MIAGIFQYAFAQAKTRTMKGSLLDAEDWHYLVRMRTLEEVLRYLSGTAHAEVVASLSGTNRNTRRAIDGFYEGLFRDYAKLMKAVPACGARLLESLINRYEAGNLKTILRGAWRAVPPSKTGPLLYQLGGLSRLPVAELLRLKEVPDAADLLKGTIFHAPFLRGLPGFKAQGRMFPIEISLDRAVLQHITEAMHSERSFSRSQARTLTGELIDWVNLTWIVRFRHFFGLSPEETLRYTLQGGSRLGLHDLGTLAGARDIQSFLNALPNPYREALEPAGRWQSIPVLFQRWFVGRLHRAFRKNPFQIGLQVSYLLLKEMEVKSLESLLVALDLGEPLERVLDLVDLPSKEDPRV